MPGSDASDFDQPAEDALRRNLPPIVGDDGGSMWFGGSDHILVPNLPLPATAADGIWFGADIQPDSFQQQTVLGTGTAGRTALRLIVNESDVPGRLSVLLRDEDGRSLVVNAQGSSSMARRVLVSAKPRNDEVRFYEIQPWADSPLSPLASHTAMTEAPSRFVFDLPFAMGGSIEDGHRQGSYTGRLAEVFIGVEAFDESKVAVLAQASANPSQLSSAGLGSPSFELQSRFSRDVRRLRTWYGQRALSLDDMEDASGLIYRWLLDTRPILPLLCRLVGVQLWLPGASERSKQYLAAVLRLDPVIRTPGARVPTASMGFQWVTAEQWLDEPAFHVHGQAVSRRAFVKFVRNKLGSGHFDEIDRKKWQRDLLSVAAELRVLDQNALAFQMFALVSELTVAVAAMRLAAVVGSHAR